MSLGQLLLAVWLIILGMLWLGWVTVSNKFLGGWAFVTGIVLILEGISVVTWVLPVGRRP